MSENFDLDTGKNIVDALKADSEAEELELNEEVSGDISDFENFSSDETPITEDFSTEEVEDSTDVETFDSTMKPSSDFENNMVENLQTHAVVDKYANDLYNFEVPNNVAVLQYSPCTCREATTPSD